MTRARAYLLVAAIVLVALNLRAAIVAVGPLLGEIRDSTGLSSSAAGLLTTLPVLCFGVLAPLAPRLAGRFGANRVVGAAMVVLAAGVLLRAVPALTALFVGTVVIGGAMAVANVLLPSIIKRDFGIRSGPVLGLYAMALSVGAAVAAGVTFPLHDAIGIGWRPALALWVLLAIVAAGAWGVATGGRTATSARGAGGPPVPITLWRDPVAWTVTIFMGFGSLQFYSTFAWFPTILVDHGMSDATAGWMLALMGITGAVSSLVVPVLAARASAQGRFVVAIIVLYVISWGGMLAAPTEGAALWAGLMGLAQGAGISLALTLMVLRAPDARHAAELSGMAQTVGYLLAAAGPFLLGAIHDLSGGWTVPMLFMLVSLAPVVVAGIAAGRPRMVGSAEPGRTRSTVESVQPGANGRDRAVTVSDGDPAA